LRDDKGGNSQLVRDSEAKRFHDPTLVDRVIDLDNQWRSSN